MRNSACFAADRDPAHTSLDARRRAADLPAGLRGKLPMPISRRLALACLPARHQAAFIALARRQPLNAETQGGVTTADLVPVVAIRIE